MGSAVSFPGTLRSPKPVSRAWRGRAGRRPAIVSGVCRAERRNLGKPLWLGAAGVTAGGRPASFRDTHTPRPHDSAVKGLADKLSPDHPGHPSPHLHRVYTPALWAECEAQLCFPDETQWNSGDSTSQLNVSLLFPPASSGVPKCAGSLVRPARLLFTR